MTREVWIVHKSVSDGVQIGIVDDKRRGALGPDPTRFRVSADEGKQWQEIAELARPKAAAQTLVRPELCCCGGSEMEGGKPHPHRVYAGTLRKWRMRATGHIRRQDPNRGIADGSAAKRRRDLFCIK
jgi:hypothetical protein